MNITVTIEDYRPSGTRDIIAVSCDCVVEDDEAWIENITDASRALSLEEELEFYAMYGGLVIERAFEEWFRQRDSADADRGDLLYHERIDSGFMPSGSGSYDVFECEEVMA